MATHVACYYSPGDGRPLIHFLCTLSLTWSCPSPFSPPFRPGMRSTVVEMDKLRYSVRSSQHASPKGTNLDQCTVDAPLSTDYSLSYFSTCGRRPALAEPSARCSCVDRMFGSCLFPFGRIHSFLSLSSLPSIVLLAPSSPLNILLGLNQADQNPAGVPSTPNLKNKPQSSRFGCKPGQGSVVDPEPAVQFQNIPDSSFSPPLRNIIHISKQARVYRHQTQLD